MTMCRVLCVARAGFYVWLHTPVSARDKDNQRLLALVRDSCSLSGGVYAWGSWRPERNRGNLR
ncbi:hypothetical protein NUBL17190_45880 [Klebsiella pneumoniae]|nr:hypothetical protein NUBL17190_45880 [Klebsiella pneumoniae]